MRLLPFFTAMLFVFLCAYRCPLPVDSREQAGSVGTVGNQDRCGLLSGKIVFSSSGSGQSVIYAMNPDGTDCVQISPEGWYCDYQSPSPDGQWIAFATTRHGWHEIYKMRADGTGLTRLTFHDNHDIYPRWSPDGRHIVWMVNDGTASWQLYVMDSDGENARRIVPVMGSFPDWSPDGNLIAFSVDVYGRHDIVTVNPDGSNQTRITFEPNWDVSSIRWSPDGKRLVFSAYPVGINPLQHMLAELFVVDLRGRNPLQLTRNKVAEGNASWSPDGKQIVFDCYTDDTHCQLYIMNADGSGRRQLTFGPHISSSPTWVK